MTPIDVVITWVDGNDLHHINKMQPYLRAEFGTESNRSLPSFSAGVTRYRSVGEIYFCIASILRFAPFIRNIFIVTDNQDPEINDFIKVNFPNTNTKINIVDHTVIFKGFESYLPVFNSRSIETALYRIPGLSENFVYFNDDVFLVRDVKPEDWFINDKVVAYGKWGNVSLIKLLRFFKPKRSGLKVFGYKDGMINAVQYLPKTNKYFQITHTPQALKKSILNDFFSYNKSAFIQNISSKFRAPNQFNPQALFYMLAFSENAAILENNNKLLYMKPVGRSKTYVDRKINNFLKHKELKFACVGSLDLAKEKDQVKIFDWLKETIRVQIEI